MSTTANPWICLTCRPATGGGPGAMSGGRELFDLTGLLPEPLRKGIPARIPAAPPEAR